MHFFILAYRRNVSWTDDVGGCHDSVDAEWIVIRRPLRGHNDTPFGRPTPGRPIGHPQGVFGVFSYYSLVMLFLIVVCLTVAPANIGTIRGVRLGVSKRVDDGRRPPALRAGRAYKGWALRARMKL
jgi:hypothetical protein